MSQETAFILDLSTWARRAWHASARDGRRGMLQTGAGMLVKLLAEKDPRWLVAAADSPGPTWRHALYPEYKAARPPHPVGYEAQLEELIGLFELHKIPVLAAPGHEADDVIATLTARFRRAEIPVVIVGADKDLRQLVTDTPPQVTMWNGKDRTITAAAIVEEMGVRPARVADLLALTGDDGDGVPGLRGVGPKRAAEWLAGTRDLEHAIALRRWGTGAPAKALHRNVEQVRLARKLVALRTDAPIGDVELDACAVGGYDVAGLRAWYAARDLPQLGARIRGEGFVKRLAGLVLADAWRGACS